MIPASSRSSRALAHRRSGFTLVEILVSLALMAFLLTTATLSFVQVKTMTARLQARQALHNTARLFYERFRFEAESICHTTAFWARGVNGGPVDLVFMRGKYDTLDFDTKDSYGFYRPVNTDLLWSRCCWDPDRKIVTLSESSQRRAYQLATTWILGGIDYKKRWFGYLPQPRRTAGPDPVVRLDDNRWGAPDPGDLGDWGDLLRNADPIMVGCTDFRCEIVRFDGGTESVSTEASSTYAVDGVHVDGRSSGAIGRRPKLIRLRFDLTDPKADITETFSFSFLAPGTAPNP